MGPLNDENKLPVDEKNKNRKNRKFFENLNFMTVSYKWTPSGKLFLSLLNQKFMRLVCLSCLHKEKNAKTAISKNFSFERKAIKIELLSKGFSIFIYFLNTNRILLFKQ